MEINIPSGDTTQSTSTWSGGITDTIITKTGAGRFIADVNTNRYRTAGFETLTIEEGIWQISDDTGIRTQLNKFSYGELIVGPQGTLELNHYNYPIYPNATLTVNGGSVVSIHGGNLCPIYTLNLNGGTISSDQKPLNSSFTLAGKVTVTKDSLFECERVTMRTNAGASATGAGTFDVQGNSVLTFNAELRLNDPGNGNAIAAVKTGTGTLVLTQSSSGTTSGSSFTVSQGTLEIRNAQALGTEDVILNGGCLKTNTGANVTLANAITTSEGTVSTLDTTSHDLTVGNIAGTGTVVKTGSGTLVPTSFDSGISLSIQNGEVDVPERTSFANLFLAGTANFTLEGNSYSEVSAENLTLAPGAVLEIDLSEYTGDGEILLFTANEGMYTMTLSAAKIPELSASLQHYFFDVREVATGVYAFDVNPATVPEPTAIMLFLGGLLLLFRRKKESRNV
ncbi:MAG: PEP-CTERM sorting domain-containing protein [Planctomycetia bacterium]|nr:PEP-CTERM sorting domain-containing protein [Planctomycetia bacterium]